jgi:hypothetical protein
LILFSVDFGVLELWGYGFYGSYVKYINNYAIQKVIIMLKLIFYLCLSILAVSLFHWTYERLQEEFVYYTQVSKVKPSDALNELAEHCSKKIDSAENTALESSSTSVEIYRGKEEVGGETKGEHNNNMEEELFQFIDKL